MYPVRAKLAMRDLAPVRRSSAPSNCLWTDQDIQQLQAESFHFFAMMEVTYGSDILGHTNLKIFRPFFKDE
jgi:hypothetical protein